MQPHSSQVGEVWDVEDSGPVLGGSGFPARSRGPLQGLQAAAWPPASCCAAGCLFQDPGI